MRAKAQATKHGYTAVRWAQSLLQAITVRLKWALKPIDLTISSRMSRWTRLILGFTRATISNSSLAELPRQPLAATSLRYCAGEMIYLLARKRSEFTLDFDPSFCDTASFVARVIVKILKRKLAELFKRAFIVPKMLELYSCVSLLRYDEFKFYFVSSLLHSLRLAPHN